MKELIKQAETARKNTELITAELNDVFANDLTFIDPSMSFEITNIYKRFCGPNIAFCVAIIDKENKYHWASDIVRVYLEITPDLQVESEFKNGSGGWIEKTNLTTDLLTIFASALQSAKQIIETTEANASKISDIITSREVYLQESYRLVEKINKINEDACMAKIQAKLDIHTRELTPVKTGRELIDFLDNQKDPDSYREPCIRIINFNFTTDTISSKLMDFSLRKNKVKRYFINNSAISKAVLLKKDMKNYFYYNDIKENLCMHFIKTERFLEKTEEV